MNFDVIFRFINSFIPPLIMFGDNYYNKYNYFAKFVRFTNLKLGHRKNVAFREKIGSVKHWILSTCGGHQFNLQSQTRSVMSCQHNNFQKVRNSKFERKVFTDIIK